MNKRDGFDSINSNVIYLSGLEIESIRKFNKISREKIGKIIGVSRTSVLNLENSNHFPTQYIKPIFEFLGLKCNSRDDINEYLKIVPLIERKRFNKKRIQYY
jgi:DNA-binding XRE family transcriptional regulator